MKIGLTSKEIQTLPAYGQDQYYLRELCWQIAKLREETLIMQSTLIDVVGKHDRPRITPMGDRLKPAVDNGHPNQDPMNDPPSLR